MYVFKHVYILNPGTSGKKGFDFYKGNILIDKGKIVKIFTHDDSAPDAWKQELSARDIAGLTVLDNHFRRMVFPGFIQSHIHFCQTMHRNLAEEMPLMQWLREEIWPFEANHSRESMGQSVLMALKEVLSSGTTAVLDMGTVHHQDVIFDIMAQVGFRYTGGKAMMDYSEGIPSGLSETTEDSIDISMSLYEKYHGANDGLLHYAFAPRFVLSCSTDLLQEVKKLSDRHNIIIHTHASEHPEEVGFIRDSYGVGNIAYLHRLEALNEHTVIAHMVHLDQEEKELAKQYKLSVAHCPTTNLKLGSGVAPIAEYLENNIMVGLGADGAPCNNGLSILNEIKMAPLLQKGTNHDPLLISPEDVLRMVSVHGAKIIRQDRHVGSIKEGMDADLVILNMDSPQTYNFEKNPTAALVYGADARNIYATMVKGKFLYKDGTYSNEIEQLTEQFNP
jgi:cytosine/adenosine deaminase-related metal-dependent hydrolase